MITVFTPTYNRKKELKRLYNTLLKQDTKNFEWLVVDDGSSDDTKTYIKELVKKKEIKINYIYKKNGGKQSAYNVGLDNAKGDIFFCIDSDDYLKANVLNTIIEDFNKIKMDDEIAGIMYVQADVNNKKKIIGTDFPNDNLIDSYYNIYNKYKVTGDKLIVFKTKVAREFYFPIIEGEKFIPEALIYNRTCDKYKFVCRNYITSYKEYLSDGYSNNYFNLVKRNPKGNALYFKESYKYNKSLYNVYGYILFSKYGKKTLKEILKEHPAKVKILLLYFPTLFIKKIRR